MVAALNKYRIIDEIRQKAVEPLTLVAVLVFKFPFVFVGFSYDLQRVNSFNILSVTNGLVRIADNRQEAVEIIKKFDFN